MRARVTTVRWVQNSLTASERSTRMTIELNVVVSILANTARGASMSRNERTLL
jgi:hypothetical protein